MQLRKSRIWLKRPPVVRKISVYNKLHGLQGPDDSLIEMPSLVIIAGPNGAGKSTNAPRLLRDELEVSEFVNADAIAQGLSAFNPERVAISAGRIMLRRIHELAEQRASFAFETTLASRTFVPWIAGIRKAGYDFHLVFLWLPFPEASIERVAMRVKRGGHYVPDDVVHRRYHSGLNNFFQRYRPLTSSWRMYDNSSVGGPRLIAKGAGSQVLEMADPLLWFRISGGE
jgi:predicted ABC-type ATPase